MNTLIVAMNDDIMVYRRDNVEMLKLIEKLCTPGSNDEAQDFMADAKPGYDLYLALPNGKRALLIKNTSAWQG